MTIAFALLVAITHGVSPAPSSAPSSARENDVTLVTPFVRRQIVEQARGTLEYTIAVSPGVALLGQSVVLTVACRAVGGAATGPSLNDKSLTVELSRVGDRREPSHAFPNRTSIADDRSVLRGGERELVTLRAGDRRTRAFELGTLFPLELLRVGDFLVGVSVWNGERSVSARPVTVRIRSAPASVSMLLKKLGDRDGAVRERAALLLHRAIGQGLDFDPVGDTASRMHSAAAWSSWWTTYGSKLPWQRTNDGTIRYREVRVETVQRERIVGALAQWRRSGTTADLRGTRWVADADVTYPPSNTVLADSAIEAALAQALAALESKSGTDSLRSTDVLLLVRTVSRTRVTPFAASMARLEKRLGSGPEWTPARLAITALRDWAQLESEH